MPRAPFRKKAKRLRFRRSSRRLQGAYRKKVMAKPMMKGVKMAIKLPMPRSTPDTSKLTR